MKKSIRSKDQLLIFLALLVWLPLSVNAQLTLPDIPSNSELASLLELSTEMVFRVKKDETYMPNGVLIAYINGEIRGAQTTSVIFPSTGIKVYKIMVFHKNPSGDTIIFKFYNIVAGKIYDVKESFEFVANLVPDYANPIILNARNQVTVETNPLGLSFFVDGITYYSPVQTYEWITGSSHVIGTSSPQGGTGGKRYVWQNWNDGGAISHTVTVPEGTTTYTADFMTQNLLTTSVSPSSGGSVTVNPTSPDGYYNSGTPVELRAVANSGYVFYSWQGDLAGMTNPQSIVMSAPRSVTAVFSIAEITVTPASVSIIGSASGSSGTFNISSNTSWSITDDGSWLTVSPISGSYNGTITVTASSANTGTSPRSATVTVAGTGVTSKTITVTQEGQINDFDGNPYNTVRIGDQLWFQENLKTTHYRNGDAIQRSDNWAALGNSTDGAYCSYDYTAAYAEIYGRLYNAYATVDNRNLCPSGWHVPTEGEWVVLENYLMANGYNYDGSTTENKIAKAMASSTDWELSSVEGAVGNTDYPEYRNKSGFTGLPGGLIYNDGIFRNLGVGAVWWTTSERDATHAVAASIWRDSASEIRSAGGGDLKTSGFSVRCLQGEGLVLPAVTTTAVTDIGTSAATGGGIITNDGGSSVTSRGVCWSTSSNPTLSDFKTSDGSGTGSFASTLTGLTPGTTYYARAYASNSTGTAYGNEIRFKTYNADAIQDIEGNYYNIVTIGYQVWMAENLKTTRYNDNNEIPLVTDNTEWSVFSTPAYCWYNNDITNKNIYGALYKRYAVNTGKLCPTGWHVPSEGEWTSLITYLGGENVAGGKLKETGTIHWFSPNTGATNESGFTALPGGARSSGSSMFFGVGGIGTWWSVDFAWYMVSNTSTVTRFGDAPEDGLSVRCLKDMAAEQSINLTEGWNIFSLNVVPEDVSMMNILQPLISEGSLIKVQDETGAAIEPIPLAYGMDQQYWELEHNRKAIKSG